jgi:hypothetical protein
MLKEYRFAKTLIFSNLTCYFSQSCSAPNRLNESLRDFDVENGSIAIWPRMIRCTAERWEL